MRVRDADRYLDESRARQIVLDAWLRRMAAGMEVPDWDFALSELSGEAGGACDWFWPLFDLIVGAEDEAWLGRASFTRGDALDPRPARVECITPSAGPSGSES